MPATAKAPTPEELRRQQLMAALANGPLPTNTQGSQTQAMPTAMTPPPGAAPMATPMPAPKHTAFIPDDTAPPAIGGNAAQPMTEIQPQTAPAAPQYQPPSRKETLLRMLSAGALEFGRPGLGAQQANLWNQQDATEKQQYSPEGMAEAQGKMQDQTLARNRAEAETRLETAQANKAENPSAPGVEEQLGEALQTNDTRKLEQIIDIKHRLYMAEHPDTPPEASGEFKNFLIGHPELAKDMPAAWSAFQLDQTKAARAGTVPADILAAHPEPSPKDFAGGEKDPAFLAAHEKWGQDVGNAKTEQLRTVAETRGAAYQRNRMYQVLDTANSNRPVYASGADIQDNPGRYISGTIGAKALSATAQLHDVRTGLDNVEEDLANMTSGFDAKTRALLAAALADPTGTPGQFLQSIERGTVLDEHQQQYVMDVFQLRERVMGLRGMLGGSSAEDVRRAMIQTLPGAATPSADYAKKQLGRVRQLIDNLELGVGKVDLRKPESVESEPQGAWAPPPGLPDVKTGNKGRPIPDGAEWQIDGKAVAKVKGGIWTAP